MQLPPHSCWPATLQPQVPLLQVEPPEQTAQLVPQWAASLSALQAPSEHFMLPDAHDELQAPFWQTCPLAQALPQLPQFVVFEATHAPLHESRPPAQTHLPAAQVLPLPQAFPHAPQFWLSDWTLAQEPPHSSWLAPHDMVPVVLLGLAHPATIKAAANRAQAKIDVVFTSI
ncbi:MAG TPA: hypothetical protein VHG72_22360 [Polyangia bacterium]|nr:hypothetical protein [Polyangia bacterium]